MTRNGIKIAKPSFDVSADSENLYVDSDTPILKIAFRGDGIMSFTSADAGTFKQVVIDHNLGYLPQYAVFAEVNPSSGEARLVSSSQIGFAGDVLVGTSAITVSQLAIKLSDRNVTDPTGDYRYLYQIYFDRA